VHTGFLVNDSLSSMMLNKPFIRYLKQVDLVLVHNHPMKLLYRKMLGKHEGLLAVYDPIPQALYTGTQYSVPRTKYIVFPASWASDEPLEIITKGFLASKTANSHRLAITGSPRRNLRQYKKLYHVIARSRGRVVLTGYLPYKLYPVLLASSSAVIAATKREYTMLSAIWEAVAYEKPFIVSRTKTLELTIEGDYPCYFRVDDAEDFAKSLDRCIQETMNTNHEEIVSTFRRLKALSEKSIARLRNRLKELLLSQES
jgi:hypothetical protein